MLRTRSIDCPYCGEPLEVEVEPAEMPQRYVEDCQVCCRPIELTLGAGPRGRLRVQRDDE